MTTLTIPQPVYGPQGQPYAVELFDGLGVSSVEWYWTAQEAWDRRGILLDRDPVQLCRILGLPCVMQAHLQQPT